MNSAYLPAMSPIRTKPLPETRSRRGLSSGVFSALLCAAMLGGCAQTSDSEADEPEVAQTPETAQTPKAEPTEQVSILRPDVEPPEIEETVEKLAPYSDVITFPEGGSTLDDNAVAALEALLASEQLALGGPVTLSAHSDSAGSDKSNLDSSEKRGLAVANWLIERGIDANRITVIAFGEQNPAQPNALPDGSANKEGRAANRRVEVLVPVIDVSEGASSNRPSNGSPDSSEAKKSPTAAQAGSTKTRD